MIKLYACIVALLFLCPAAFCQAPSVSISSNEFQDAACLNRVYQLPVIINGDFNADNKFSVQVRINDPGPVLGEIPAVLIAGKLEFTFSDSLAYGNSYVQLRVVSSSPRVTSIWSQRVAVQTKGSIIINPAAVVDTLNPFERANVSFEVFSMGQSYVTLNDSSTFSTYGSTLATQSLPVNPSGQFTIAHARNGCGLMRTSGVYTYVLNAPALRVISASPAAICENSDFNILYSIAEPAFTSATKYKVRFTLVEKNGDVPMIVEVPATAEKNYLKVKFPDRYKMRGMGRYKVQMITENPATVSAPMQGLADIWASPGASFNSQSTTIGFAEPVNLQVTLTGLPPFTVELSNGAIETSTYSTASFNLRPIKSESFTIKSLTSGCGKTEIKDPQVVEVKVATGIRMDESEMQFTCAGPNARLKFVTNAPLTDATRFTVQVQDPSTGRITSWEARRSGDYLEFNAPQDQASYEGHSFRIITSNPALQSAWSTYLTIRTLPNVNYEGYNNTLTFDSPHTVPVSFILSGGGPYTIEYPDGSTQQQSSSGYILTQPFFARQTSDFRIKSVSNTCFKNDNPRSARITITQPKSPVVYMEPVAGSVCKTDSLEIVFGAIGEFNPGNRFVIQGYGNNCCDFQNLRSVESGGKYKIKISSDQFYSNNAAIRIASTNPVVFSEVQYTTVQAPAAQINLLPASSPENPITYVAKYGVYRSVTLQSPEGNIDSFVYTINGEEKTFFNESRGYMASFPVSPPAGSLAVYEFKSVTNSCGTVPVNQKSYVQAMPYSIQFIYSSYNTALCVGDPLAIPFGVSDGSPTAATTFDLQILREGSTGFSTLVKGERTSVMRGFLPDTLSTGTYYIRIVSSDGAISDNRMITIGAAPTATLQSEGQGETIPIDPGQPLRMRVILTGSGPWTTMWSDNLSREHYSAQEDVNIYPTDSQEYQIRMVANSCGYGRTSGVVKVTVKPKLYLNPLLSAVCAGSPFEVDYALTGVADLSDTYIRFVLVESGKNNEIPLDSTKIKSGRISLRIPATLTGQFYQLKAVVDKYSLVATSFLGVTSKPNLTISGSTIINAGKSAFLSLKSDTYTGTLQYRLSDGTTSTTSTRPGFTTYAVVSPRQTTTYTIQSVTNACGEGDKSGSAVVEVNPASSRTIDIDDWNSSTGGGFCMGDTISIIYSTTGSFTPGNKMTAQISNNAGQGFRPLVTIGNASPLKAVIPTDLTSGSEYRIRVVASDPNTGSGASSEVLIAAMKAKARFTSEFVIFDGKQNPRITVQLEGGGPWQYVYGTDAIKESRMAYEPIDEIELFQASPNQYYRLFSVTNGCGFGTIENPSIVKVEMITGVEPRLDFAVTVSPNPGQNVVKVEFKDSGKKLVRIVNMQGKEFRHFTTYQTSEMLDISDLAAGSYLLTVEAGDRKGTFRMVKGR